MKKFFKKIGNGIEYFFKFIIGILAVIFCVIIYLPTRLIYPIKVSGAKNLKRQPEGQLIACNHFSNMDVIILQILFFKSIWNRKFLAKKELGSNVFTRVVVGGIGAIFIDRKGLDMKAMRETLNSLKSGKNVIIFPEGTRNKTGSEDIQDLKSGVIFFADRAKCNIVPMIIKHRLKPFRKNEIIIDEGYKIEKSGKHGQAEELEKLNQKFDNLRTR